LFSRTNVLPVNICQCLQTYCLVAPNTEINKIESGYKEYHVVID
jgi:hypothetical protein